MAGLSAENPLRGAFQPRVIKEWSQRLQSLDPGFPADSLTEAILAGWGDLGFGERSARIRDLLDSHLPGDFPQAARLLVQALDPPLGPEELAPLERFLVWPQTAWVAQRARLCRDFETAARTLREMTMRFSAEGDLRVLFELDAVRALSTLKAWVHDPNPHVRRLVSEGTRPRLPLAPRWRAFDADPEPILNLLESLRDDESLYVRRSVANNLNDWSKDHADTVVRRLTEWGRGAPEPRLWLIRHAARTLVKKGHPEALRLLGVDPDQAWSVEDLGWDPDCEPGGSLRFRFHLVHAGTGPAQAVVDFTLGPVGSPHRKVYKLRRYRSAGGQSFLVEGLRSLVPTSGRTWRPGPHRLVILVNGRPSAETVVRFP